MILGGTGAQAPEIESDAVLRKIRKDAFESVAEGAGEAFRAQNGPPVGKGALKLAKPAGVLLNVFTVERALKKMKKLNTLGENVMFIFGNVHELLEFCQSYPFPEVNFGAAANHDGASPVGGKDSSVFLDAAERADAQKLLDLGVKVYEQQTPTQARTDISAF